MVFLAIGFAFLLDLPAAMAQQQYVFPNKGQTPEQQKKDEYDCHLWAVQQTNFDPTSAAQAQQPASAQPGSGANKAAKGAVVGAAAGSMGGEAGKGAAVGAAVGVVGGRVQSKKQQSQKQQEASAQQAPKQQDYLRARATCLEAKGYSVK